MAGGTRNQCMARLAEKSREMLREGTPTSRQVTKGCHRKAQPRKGLTLAFALARRDRRTRTLGPQTSTVSTYHAYKREGLRPYRTAPPQRSYLFQR
jgi:hypothetical protein